MADWADLILAIGDEHGYWPDDREIVTTPGRLRPGATDVMALRVGYEKLQPRDRLEAARLLGGRRPAHDRVVRREPRPLASAASTGCRPARPSPRREASSSPAAAASSARTSSSGSRPTGTTSFAARRRDYDLTVDGRTRRASSPTRDPELVFHLAAEVGGIGANRANPGPLLVREPRHGRARARAEPAARGRQARRRRHRLRLPEAHARPVPRGRRSGTATRRRRTRPTASRRRRCSSARRPTASSTG